MIRTMALGLVFATSMAHADDAPAPAAKPDWRDKPIEHEDNRAHFLGLRANIGSEYELGVGYIHAHESLTKTPFGGYFWFGYGADARVVLRGDGPGPLGATGWIATLVGRTSYVGHGLPTGFELALGVGSGLSETRMVASAGVFVSLYYADFGYEYQLALLPFDRPDWLGAHFFAMRGHIPVHRYAKKKWTAPSVNSQTK